MVRNIYIRKYIFIFYGVALYGEVMLNMLIYLPLQFIGYGSWKKNRLEMKSETVVKAKRLTRKNWLFLIPVIFIAGIAYMKILTAMGGQQAGVDSFAVVLSVTANILMVKRFVEQWVMWIVVNVLSIIIWLNVFLVDGNSVTILVMWTAYLMNSIYGYIKWLKMSKAAVLYEDKEVAIND